MPGIDDSRDINQDQTSSTVLTATQNEGTDIIVTKTDSQKSYRLLNLDKEMSASTTSATNLGQSEDSASRDSITGEQNCPLPIPTVETIITTPADSPVPSADGPLIRVIPPGVLALNVEPDQSATNARKSPVTVQEWVDSLPPPNLRDDTTPDPWPEPVTAALKREASVQSDAGSHCSSVESLLGSRKPDPEDILIGLGFGGSSNEVDSDVARIPRRFLRPSKVKGVAINDFLRHQHDLVKTFESGFSGYRGLTATGSRPPSIIVGKIMEQLKLKLGAFGLDYPLPTASQRFSRAARKVINVLPSSVLSPDNRQFLDSQGGKSPEVPRKRMIIDNRSFTFDREGHLLEAAKSRSVSSEESETSPLVKDGVTSKSLSSSEIDHYEDPFVPNLTSTVRSFSVDSSDVNEANSSPIISSNLADNSPNCPPDVDFSYQPSYSASSRSVSIDSSDAHHNVARNTDVTWDLPLNQRLHRHSSTSISSWESSSPKGDVEKPFTRYESIEEASERGSEMNASREEVPSMPQQRRGSLKRQQHVEEDVVPASSLHVLEESDVFSSRETLHLPSADDDATSMNSSTMEELLNPRDSNINQERSETFDEPPVQLQNVDNLNSSPITSGNQQEVEEEVCVRKMSGAVAPLLRGRSDSSGFLDLEGDWPSHEQDVVLDADERTRRELDELVQELMNRGVKTTNCRDTAVRLAVNSYGEQLKREMPTESDLIEARCDILALRQLRELVAIELRRVADLLDEQPSGASVPAVTVQMTALLRQQTKLRHQLESLGDSCSEPAPSCSEVLTLVRDGHRHLECLIEKNSRELADIRRLLHELITATGRS